MIDVILFTQCNYKFLKDYNKTELNKIKTFNPNNVTNNDIQTEFMIPQSNILNCGKKEDTHTPGKSWNRFKFGLFRTGAGRRP